jgi:tetratricopeptide (TPR) repeat protein
MAPEPEAKQEQNEHLSKTDALIKVLEEAETLKLEGTRIFNESPKKSDSQLERAMEKYLESSRVLLSKGQEFVKDPAVKDLYFDGIKSANMNAAMMALKLKQHEKSIDLLKFAKAFFTPKEDMIKLSYRLAANYNALERYDEALEVLKSCKDKNDPLIKLEYSKALSALKAKNKVTESEKETYSKMFDPDTRKKIEKKRKEEKELQKDEKETNGSSIKYIVGALAVIGLGFLIVRNLRK